MSAIEENKAIVCRFFEEAWNEKKIADLHQYWSDNNVHHFGMAERAAGPDVAKQVMETWWTAFPDFRYHIGALIAEDDLVAARVTFSGTHTGVFKLGSRTITPTNKPLCDTEMFVFRITDGKIVESWSAWDQLNVLTQLGAVEK
jgi:predicted ester cyclase